MVSKKLQLGAAVLALYTLFPVATTVRADDDVPAKPMKYTDPDVQKLSDRIDQLKKKIEDVRNNSKLSEDTKQARIEVLEANIADAEQGLSTEKHDENAVNRKAGKVARDELTILNLKEEIYEVNAQWDDDQKNDIKYTDEQIQKLKEDQAWRVRKIGALEARIGRKKSAMKRRFGVDYDSLVAPKIDVKHPDVKLDPPTKTVTEAELRKKQDCWDSEKALDKRLTKFFDLGKSDIDAHGKKTFPDNLKKIKEEAGLDDNTKISSIEFVAHNSNVPDVDELKPGVRKLSSDDREAMHKGDADELAKERRENAIKTFKANVAGDGSDVDSWKGAFSPSGPLDQPFREHHEFPVEVGPSWKPNRYAEMKKIKVDHKGVCLSKNANFAKECTPSVCAKDEVCRRAQVLLRDLDKAPSGAAVLDKDGSGDLQKTVARLETCCSANRAELVYKPHQYVTMKIYTVKFNPKAPGCVADGTKVTGETTKPVESTFDNECNPSAANYESCKKAAVKGAKQTTTKKAN